MPSAGSNRSMTACFPSLAAVTALGHHADRGRGSLRAERLFCVVPGPMKRAPVAMTLQWGRSRPTVPPASCAATPTASSNLDRDFGSRCLNPLTRRALPGYLAEAQALMRAILEDERDAIDRAADKVADQIAADRLVHIYGPRPFQIGVAGDLLPRRGRLIMSAPSSTRARCSPAARFRSMAMNDARLRPRRHRGLGLGRAIILILANAYGINAALIDARHRARARGVFLIGFSSRTGMRRHGSGPPAAGIRRSITCDLVDIAIDTKVRDRDALVSVPGLSERIAAGSTFANAFALNNLVIRTVAKLAERGVRAAGLALGQCAGGRCGERPLRRAFGIGCDGCEAGARRWARSVGIRWPRRHDRGAAASPRWSSWLEADGPYLAPGLIDLQVNLSRP